MEVVEVFKNITIAKNTAQTKIVQMDTRKHTPFYNSGAKFQVIIEYTKSGTTSDITITASVTTNGITWYALTLDGASGANDVTASTAAAGWDENETLHPIKAIKVTVTENDAAALTDLDLVVAVL